MKVWKHFKKIMVHKYWVAKYAFKTGIPWQGITHDLSKFSPVEFWESVKYYQGNGSPIDACKKANGYSMAWMHHKGRNPHHYEYWQDNFDHGGNPLIMPYKYTVEMLCDYLAAARAYMGKDFTYDAEFEWWLKKNENGLAMHPVNKQFLTVVLDILKCGSHYSSGEFILHKDYLSAIYEGMVKKWNEMENEWW